MSVSLQHAQTEDLVSDGYSYGSVTQTITSIPLANRAPKSWRYLLVGALLLMMLFLTAVTYLFALGVGIWGINIPVAWGFAIVNFVWWIGIGHAGTLISAILLLCYQPWRNSINRFAEAMTLFALVCAASYPVLHLGRPWLFYWLFPYPNTMGLWPQFRSPLIWDIFAVSTYTTVSILFWYVGLIPDLAAMRDRTKHKTLQQLYGIFALGWRGSALHWCRYQAAYLVLAGLATPLVVSVHSVVSFDFSVSLIPGWHSTIFPPYFVAGAIFSGFAMVLTLAIPFRAIYGLHGLITDRHLDLMAQTMLASGLIVAYSYIIEIFMGWYGGNQFEKYMLMNRALGPYSSLTWGAIIANVVAPQLLWWPKIRRHAVALFFISIVINIGMWLERYVIVVTSLHRDFLPSSWGIFNPTRWDWMTYIGSIGLFLTLFLLFIRLLPSISITDMRELLHARGRDD